MVGEVHEASGKVDGREAGATTKGAAADVGDCVGQPDGPEGKTALKCIRPDLGEAIGQVDACKVGVCIGMGLNVGSAVGYNNVGHR